MALSYPFDYQIFYNYYTNPNNYFISQNPITMIYYYKDANFNTVSGINTQSNFITINGIPIFITNKFNPYPNKLELLFSFPNNIKTRW